MDFGVVIPLADEGPVQLTFCLENLRKAHPDVPVRVLGDGFDHPGYPEVCKRFGATYVPGKFLKRIECGGRWWERTLRQGLATGKPWFIKIDPDSRFWRPFRHLPRYPVSGSPERVGHLNETVHGGCQSFSVQAARKILDSSILYGDALTDHNTFCPDRAYLKSWQPQGYFGTDFSLMYLLRELNIEFGDWPEVGSRWQVAPPNFDLRYAITHPHKLPNCPVQGVGADVPIRIITTCKGRLHHLKQTLPAWLREENVHITVVDWSCPQSTLDWVKSLNNPRVVCVKKEGEKGFNLSAARNFGASHTPRDDIWAFLDADFIMRRGWAEAVRSTYKKYCYHIAYPLHYSMTGSVVLAPEHYYAVGGYDDNIKGWGCDDLMFYLRLRTLGVRPSSWPGEYADTIQHTNAERTEFYDIKQKWRSNAISNAYYRSVARLTVETGKLPTREECLALHEKAVAQTDHGWRVGTPGKGTFLAGHGYSVPQPAETSRPGKPGTLLEDEGKPRELLIPEERLLEPPASPNGDIPLGWPVDTPTDGSEAPPDGLIPLGEPEVPYVYAPVTDDKAKGEPVFPNVCVVNHATIDLGLPLEELVRLGNKYVGGPLRELWPGRVARLHASVKILPKMRAIILMDNAEHNKVLGYHDSTPEGLPLTKVFIKDWLTMGHSTTEVFTHDLAEFLVDPDCNLEAVDAIGRRWALEVSDPTEEDYFLLDGYRVTNLLAPAYFESYHKPGEARFDFMGLVKRPFELRPGGYALIIDPQLGQTSWQEQFGSLDKGHRFALENRTFHRTEIRKHRQHLALTHAHRQYVSHNGGRRPLVTHA